jgi:hypothetical protein
MKIFKRRKLLAMAASMLAAGWVPFAASAGRPPRPGGAAQPAATSPPPGSPPCAEGDSLLIEQARAWIDQLRGAGETRVLHPVSRLQRTLRTGYSRTCAVVATLEQEGKWTIAYTGDGTRYARLHGRTGDKASVILINNSSVSNL